MSSTPSASVIVTTYNHPRYLELALLGLARQTRRDFEIIVADDGSGPETKGLIDRLRRDLPVPLLHVWQEDLGFRQARAMNLAALRATSPHLIFTDGDCVPPADFVDSHLQAAQPNTLIVGWCVRLSEPASAAVTPELIRSGALQDQRAWPVGLLALALHLKNLLYLAIGHRKRPKIQGLNFSIPRATFEALNGLDLNYENNAQQDSDLRNRLRRAGLPARSIVHRCIVVHLWHPTHAGRHAWKEARSYYRRKSLEPWAQTGLRELAAELGNTPRSAGMPAETQRNHERIFEPDSESSAACQPLAQL